MTNIPIQEFLEYEVRSSWWARDVFWGWGQDLTARYFAWKTRKKYARYINSLEIQKKLLTIKNQQQ